MADKNMELLLRIIAQVDGLRDVEGLRSSVESLDPALSTLAERAKAALNPMDGLANSASNFGDAVKATTQPMADLASNALKVTSVAAALATALGGAVYQEAKKFESAQLDLKKVLGGTQEELDIYGRKLNDLALEFGVSSNALTASMADFVQAGFDADAAINLVRQSTKLKVAGDLEAAQSSEYLVRMLKGFGAEASDSARFVDVLNAVSQKYATNAGQLAEAMSRVAPIAKQMGLSFEETAAAVTPMIESFGSGAEASEAFKTGVLKLIDDAKPVKDALQSMGIAQTDLNGNLRSGKDILNDVMVAFQSADRTQKLYLTSQLVGIDQAPRLVETFDNLNKVLGVQAAGLAAAGSAQEEVNIRLQSAETIGNRTAESFRQLAVALGTNYRDEVKGVIDATGALARGFIEAEKAGSMDGLFAAVKPQLEAVEALFRQMAANLPAAFAHLDFSPLTSAITDLGGEVSQAFAAFMGSIDLTTVDGLRQLLQGLADGMAALIRFTAGALDQMEPFFSAMGKSAQFAAENADSISRLAGEVAGFSFTVNKLIPLLADMAAGTFSIIGTAADAAFSIGLVVGAVKLLNLAGISVLPLLGSLAAGIGGLSVGTVTLGAAFAGIPGVLLGVVGAAGAAGYAVGSAGVAIADAVAPSWSLGSAIYDLVGVLNRENREAEQAKIVNQELARIREEQAVAAKKQTEAEREKTLAMERERKAAEEATTAAIAADAANRQLTASFQEAGLIWNKTTGELVRVSDAMNGIAPASLTVKNALRELGVDYAAFNGGISEGAEKSVIAFKKITDDVTTNAPVISAALLAAINKAQTVGDIEAIGAAFDKFAANGKLSAEQVAAANALIAEKLTAVKNATDPLIKLNAEYVKIATDMADKEMGVAKATLSHLNASLEVAKASKNEYEARRLVVEIATQESTIAQLSAARKNIEAKAAADVYKALLQEAQQRMLLGESLTDEERKRISVAQIGMQTASIQAQAAGMVAEAEQKKAAAIALGSLQNQQNTESTAQNTEVVQKNTAANRDSIDILKAMVAQLDSARSEMKGLSDTAEIYFDLMLAHELDMKGFAGAYEETRRQQIRFKEAISETDPELSKLREGLATAEMDVRDLGLAMITSANSFAAYEIAIKKAKAETIAAFNEQAIRALELTRRYEEFAKGGADAVGGITVTMNELNSATRESSSSMNLLDKQRLDQLNSAIEAANDKLREMQNEAQDAQTALAEMNAELLAEQGNTAAADRLKLQIERSQRLAELEQKRLEAEATGNKAAAADYARMIGLLDDVIAAKSKNLEAEIAGNDKTTKTNQAAITQAGELATALERSASAAKTLNSVPLDGLLGNLNQVGESVNRLRSAL